MRWRLILEEFGPELIYLKGEKNIVADAISRLNLMNGEEDVLPPVPPSLHSMAHTFGLDVTDDPESTSTPVTFKNLLLHQQKDKTLLRYYRTKECPYSIDIFHGTGKARKLICYKIKLLCRRHFKFLLLNGIILNSTIQGKSVQNKPSNNIFLSKLRDDVVSVCS